MHLVFLCLVLTSLVTGATNWSPFAPHHHRFVVEFEEEPDGNTKVSISQHDDDHSVFGAGGFTCPRELFGKCRNKLASSIAKTKNMVSGTADEVSSKFHSFEDQSKEVVDGAVGKVGDPKVKLSEKLPEKVKVVGEKAKEVAGNIKNAVTKTLGTFTVGESTKGTLKDSVVKMEQWDLVDSPRRIGEDIERNASRKVEQGVEEVKETMEIVKETSWNDLLTTSTRKVTVLVDKIQSVISWCHLLGFSTAYGMGVWVTFFSSCVLGKCLPKRQYQMIANKLYMVYFRAMAYCIGAALIGYVVSRGRRLFFLGNKMEIFQGFNLLSALMMNLTNVMFLEPRAMKLIAERKKIKENRGTKSVAAEKVIKKLITYSSTLNVSTMVVLTWHLAYIGQLLQAARHP